MCRGTAAAWAAWPGPPSPPYDRSSYSPSRQRGSPSSRLHSRCSYCARSGGIPQCSFLTIDFRLLLLVTMQGRNDRLRGGTGSELITRIWIQNRIRIWIIYFHSNSQQCESGLFFSMRIRNFLYTTAAWILNLKKRLYEEFAMNDPHQNWPTFFKFFKFV